MREFGPAKGGKSGIYLRSFTTSSKRCLFCFFFFPTELGSLLPKNCKIIGYGRSKNTAESLRERISSGIPGSEDARSFLGKVFYCQGEYSPKGFSQELKREIQVRLVDHSTKF